VIVEDGEVSGRQHFGRDECDVGERQGQASGSLVIELIQLTGAKGSVLYEWNAPTADT
jgi:hypothetical protein